MIGGFTTKKWNQGRGHQADVDAECFIFSLSMKEKMILTDKKHAIYCNSTCGPVFGAGSDIFIEDSAQVNKSSFKPHSYSLKFKNDPKSEYTVSSFSGGAGHCKIKEY